MPNKKAIVPDGGSHMVRRFFAKRKLPSSALSASGSQGIISARKEHPCFIGKVTSKYSPAQVFPIEIGGDWWSLFSQQKYCIGCEPNDTRF